MQKIRLVTGGFAIFIVFILGGCGHSIDTPLQKDPTKSPFAHDTKSVPGISTSYCAPDAGGVYPGETILITKKLDNGQHDVGEGGACILKSLADVWHSSQTEEALSWDRATLKWLKEIKPAPSGTLLALQSFYDAGFFQNFTIDWIHKDLDGPADAPTKILITYNKVKGTSYISFWEGSIELQALTPTVTSVRMTNEISAAQTGPEEAAKAVKDMITRLRK